MAPRIGTTPKPKRTGSRKKAAEAVAKANEMVSGAGSQPKPESPPTGSLEPETAPAFGTNEPDEGTFLHHVRILVEQDSRIDVQKEILKGLRKERKSLRDEAKAVGVVMGELDRAVKDAQTELVDLEAKERRYLLYMRWLGCPLDIGPAKAPPKTKEEVAKAQADRWEQEGYRMGILGKPRSIPEGCPPESQQDLLRGHERGQNALMKSSPLTREAFEERAQEGGGAPAEADGVLTLGVEHFVNGVELTEANLANLLPAWEGAWHKAKDIVVIIGGQKRVLKDSFDNYEDTGAPDVPLSEVEPLEETPAEADSFA